MNKSIEKIIALVLVLSSITSITGCSTISTSDSDVEAVLLEPVETKIDTYKVTRGDIRFEDNNIGDVFSEVIHNLSMPMEGGILEEVNYRSGDTVSKGDIIAKCHTGEIEHQINMQELLIEKKLLEIEKFKSEGNREADIAIMKKDLEIEEEQLRYLKEKRESFIFRSPIDGIISEVIKAKLGSEVDGKEKIAVVQGKDSLVVKATPRKIWEYYEGMQAEIVYQNIKYEGVVKEISDDKDENQIEIVKVVIGFKDDIPESIQVGESVHFNVVGEWAKDAVIVPTESVKRDKDGNNYVLTVVDGIKEKRIVNIGISNDEFVEITKGLEEGEEIIVR